MVDEQSLEELLNEFTGNWQRRRSDANAVEELCIFLERFSKCLAKYDEMEQAKLASAVLLGMFPTTRINFLMFTIAATIMMNIEGDRKIFLKDFMWRLENILDEMQKVSPHLSPSSSLH